MSATYGMSSRASGYQILPNLLLRLVDGTPRGNKYPKDIHLLTHLTYLPPKGMFYLCIKPHHGVLYQLSNHLELKH